MLQQRQEINGQDDVGEYVDGLDSSWITLASHREVYLNISLIETFAREGIGATASRDASPACHPAGMKAA
jgi:hypothetical protein